jgi:two-component system, OmpR family, phosphate regulon sensor histidine kinase PhoR
MLPGFDLRTALACLIAVVAGVAVWMLTREVDAAAVTVVGGAAAALLASGGEEVAEPARPSPVPESALESLIEAVSEPLLLVEDNRVQLANAAARTLLGSYIIGEDVRVAIRHPAAADRLSRPDGADERPVDLVGLGPLDQRWRLRAATLADGRRLVELRDRTGSHAAERARVDFVANASHELRTPLASILGFIETLEEAGEDPAVRARFLEIMGGEARRMRRLVDDLISLSRIEAEKYRLPATPVDLGELVEEVRAELIAGGNPRANEVVAEIAEVPAVGGDRAQLSQALHNLAGNAMKYARAGTPVVIRVQPDGPGMVRLSVRDQGDGIAAEHLPRLTERFYRVDPSRSRTLGGTGLGLAIVKHIVERHRGRLDIASQLGVGTTVTVTLPALSSPRHATVTEA